MNRHAQALRPGQRRWWRHCAALIAGVGLSCAASAANVASAPTTSADIVAAAPDHDWRPLRAEHTLYVELPAGRITIELEPGLAPRMVARIEALARLHYYDGLSIVRVQDNYVAQWGDPDDTRKLPESMPALAPEFSVRLGAGAFSRLDAVDGYAPEVGFVDSFPAARDPVTGRAWLTHCYGAVGVGRGNDPASGTGGELYVVIGHAPRHLDGNVVVVGRVRQGIEKLSSLPRGTGELGFYLTPGELTPVRNIRLAAELPETERSRLEVLRSDSASFASLIGSRRVRREGWFVHSPGYVDLCNVPLPVRSH